MKALCKPLRCLSFLNGRSRPEYSPVDGPHGSGVGKSGNEDNDDEDDFFGDSWGSGNDSAPSKEAEAKSQGLERNPTRETTTKRSGGSSSNSNSGVSSSSGPQPKAPAPKKDMDFFNELGMEPEYKAPRTRTNDSPYSGSATSKTRSVSAMLEEGGAADGEAGGGWGDDALDLKL
mmetsp:Transcript_32715/g.90258  ORF Transcript_32715/g.90258 Transcript_32715/m.90258 type:complete len:175 (+) Transcript_32715:95-619(+)